MTIKEIINCLRNVSEWESVVINKESKLKDEVKKGLLETLCGGQQYYIMSFKLIFNGAEMSGSGREIYRDFINKLYKDYSDKRSQIIDLFDLKKEDEVNNGHNDYKSISDGYCVFAALNLTKIIVHCIKAIEEIVDSGLWGDTLLNCTYSPVREIKITATGITIDDEPFNTETDNGDDYQLVEVFYMRSSQKTVYRSDRQGERLVNTTLPRLVFQVFGSEIEKMSDDERREILIDRKNNGDEFRGIYTSENEYRSASNNKECIELKGSKRSYYIHHWSKNRFSNFQFAQYCLSEFNGGCFIIKCYNEKRKFTSNMKENNIEMMNDESHGELVKKYAEKLKESKNIILRGAPGTGKTYLAKQVAAYLISGESIIDCEVLSDEGKRQLGFVQFHPSYDYSDFVEGLRPVKSKRNDGQIAFELKDGIFKEFVDRAGKKENSDKKYVFIIDEINRGEISKIFGELFFSIDPGYRGESGAVLTQYANLHTNPDEKFYVPKNVYIIGTMNDIDRSVDCFDFAMRRRFRFIELKANERVEMLDVLDSDKCELAKVHLTNLNNAIVKETNNELNENYQIGGAYFLKLKDINYDYSVLWDDYLEPLLVEYVQGMSNERELINRFKEAYNRTLLDGGDRDEYDKGQ